MRSILKYSRKDLFGTKTCFPINTLAKHNVSILLRHKHHEFCYTSLFKPSCKYLEWVFKKCPIGNQEHFAQFSRLMSDGKH